MTTTRTKILALATILAIALASWLGNHTGHPAETPNGHPTTTTTHCAEDDPCWDCSTMGNHICGKEVG